MTPRQCLEARARLGWSRQDLAAATALATPIIRMFEAGALEGFSDCEAAIAEALAAAETSRHDALSRAPGKPGGALVWLIEARRRWRSARWAEARIAN